MAKDIRSLTSINDFQMHIYDTYTESEEAKVAACR